MGQEKRRLDRYELEGAQLSILSMTEEEAEAEFKAVTPLDFNRFGLSFDSQHPYQAGDVLRIQLQAGDEAIGELIGFICSSLELDGHYRCGVQFDFNPQTFAIGVELQTVLELCEAYLRFNRPQAS